MKTKPDKKGKSYDAVKSMREIRDQLSREITDGADGDGWGQMGTDGVRPAILQF